MLTFFISPVISTRPLIVSSKVSQLPTKMQEHIIMKNSVVKVLHSAVICAVGLTGSNVGYAQGDTTVLALEEVVVVARKRTENLQEVPVNHGTHRRAAQKSRCLQYL